MIETKRPVGEEAARLYRREQRTPPRKSTVLSYRQPHPRSVGRAKDNVRLNLPQGAVSSLNGADEYTVNVYRHSANNITQEQILPDLRRYVRY